MIYKDGFVDNICLQGPPQYPFEFPFLLNTLVYISFCWHIAQLPSKKPPGMNNNLEVSHAQAKVELQGRLHKHRLGQALDEIL